ncbi:3-hydroxyacyl-ACP dehydratase FabZ family protein [Namhaeicola litoreus]|uniref:3-hydroxyacyl-ACP dehydratase FabZ family protein n=1 Tax=Namhaeicola litoreus TaxID=1052145 RepID=A0ABW3Y313_9FLAO
MNSDQIIAMLPYQKPFLFVDQLLEISEEGVTGEYTYSEDEYFYRGHFKNEAITPGVILTETMAQIGVVCLGIVLIGETQIEKPSIALTSQKIDFYLPVYPKERVVVKSEKLYFRFGKLKCSVNMFNAQEKLVCRGEISGMIK